MNDNGKSSSSNQMFLTCIQCFFISVATILGTGILGLPLKVYKCGFYPFLVTFLPSLLIQILLVHFFTELLQICEAALKESLHEVFSYNPLGDVPLLDRTHPSNSSNFASMGENNSISSNESISNRKDEMKKDPSQVSTNLHIMGKLFLPLWMQVLFYIALAINFTAILTSYGLAGGEAFGQLVHVKYNHIISAFVWPLVCIIIFGFSFVQPIITTLTLAKGTVFVIMACVGVIIGNQVQNPILTDWSAAYQPLLMETVALGGLPLVMPLLYEKFRDCNKSDIKKFKLSIYAALIFSAILNILWAWSVLSVVPQFDLTCRSKPVVNSSQIICQSTQTIEGAENGGVISTVPFTEVIMKKIPKYSWIAILVQMFVVISVTVSFLTIGSSMFHSIIGLVNYLISNKRNSESQPITNKTSMVSPTYVWRTLSGFLAFSIIFFIAIAQPKSFVKLLDKVVSTCGNFMFGPVVFTMYYRSHQEPYRNLTILLRTEPIFRPLIYLVLFYFSGAIIYTIVDSILEASL